MPYAAARTATRDEDASRYQRHRPEQTLLYRIVEEYYPTFAAHLAMQSRELPDYVHREFEDYLKCGRLEHGFLRVRCGIWSLLAVNEGASVPAAGHGAWPKAQRCWSMKSCLNSPYASGC